MQKQLFVGNLAFSTTHEDLEAAFSAYGTVEEVKIPTDRDTGRVRGFAFVTFNDNQSAEKALALDGTDLNGRPIRVNFAQAKEGGSGGRSGGGGARGGRGGSHSGGGGGRRGGSAQGGGGRRDTGNHW